MALRKRLYIFLLLFLVSASKLKAQVFDWQKEVRESKKIDNINYFFPAEVPIERRNAAIKECQESIKENLKLINETTFTNEMEIEFFKSKKEMLKYGGMATQGLAFPERNTFFTLLKDTGSPIKHEMMHMITVYKWGIPANSSTWMNEGLATYAGGTCSKYSLEEIYQYFIQSGKLISTSVLANDFYANHDMISYTESAYLVKYLIDNYGLEKFIKLWQQGYENFRQIYGIGVEKIELKIKEDLQIKYSKDIEFDWEKFSKGCI